MDVRHGLLPGYTNSSKEYAAVTLAVAASKAASSSSVARNTRGGHQREVSTPKNVHRKGYTLFGPGSGRVVGPLFAMLTNTLFAEGRPTEAPGDRRAG